MKNEITTVEKALLNTDLWRYSIRDAWRFHFLYQVVSLVLFLSQKLQFSRIHLVYSDASSQSWNQLSVLCQCLLRYHLPIQENAGKCDEVDYSELIERLKSAGVAYSVCVILWSPGGRYLWMFNLYFAVA